MKKPELLAPAGDLEKLKIALLYGADAVFIGGKQFSLRARASNFDMPVIAEGCRFAKSLGKKVFVTVNILPKEDDLEGLVPYLQALEKSGVDAIIVASTAVLLAARNHTHLEVHLSTQQSVTNGTSVNFWGKAGYARVVLARELTLEEIAKVRGVTDTELEVFIHGGMCVSYSGKCTLSNTMTDRDANRGGCAHSCRWDYRLSEEGRSIGPDDTPFAMSSKDLQSLQHIEKLMRIGVDALKIEGRMKSIHYIATVVSTYRHLIDAYHAGRRVDLPAYVIELAKAENRLTSDGFLGGMTRPESQLYNMRSEQPSQAFAGIVRAYDVKNHTALVEQRNLFTTGDSLEVLSPQGVKAPFVVGDMFDEEGFKVTVARHPKQRLIFTVPYPLEPYDLLRRTNHADSVVTHDKT
ncbi:MAG: U32 family peptidase [Acholeplasmatales bacterium]|nr:MAG: U32 family peptidase [Acholeplasmatales bacterium]